jgi:hypothetical protein
VEEAKGKRAEKCIKKNDIGIIFAINYASDAARALLQTKAYQKLVNDSKVKVFACCKISKSR